MCGTQVYNSLYEALKLHSTYTADSDLVLEDAEEYLNANNENTALWYALPETDLEPLDPC